MKVHNANKPVVRGQRLIGYVRNPQLEAAPLRDSKAGICSVGLNGRWRLVLSRGSSEDQMVVEEAGNHYGEWNIPYLARSGHCPGRGPFGGTSGPEHDSEGTCNEAGQACSRNK